MTVNVGTPIAVDNPTVPTIVQFPFSFTKPAGTLANGSYTFSIQSPPGAPVVSKDGKDLVASGQDLVHARRRDRTGRHQHHGQRPNRSDSVQQGARPAPSPSANIFVIRKGGAPIWPPIATDYSSYINLNSDPRATISYRRDQPQHGPATTPSRSTTAACPRPSCRPTSTRSSS